MADLSPRPSDKSAANVQECDCAGCVTGMGECRTTPPHPDATWIDGVGWFLPVAEIEVDDLPPWERVDV